MIHKNTFGKGVLFENFVSIMNGWEDKKYTHFLCSKIYRFQAILKELRKIEVGIASHLAKVTLHKYHIKDTQNKLQTHYNSIITANYRAFLKNE